MKSWKGIATGMVVLIVGLGKGRISQTQKWGREEEYLLTPFFVCWCT